MKNLFDYATKELSQDAFLMWLFANYDEPELAHITCDLLKAFCDGSQDEKILDVKIWRQYRKIDIWFEIKTNKRNKINLLIEDKTYSCEHNQLEKYNIYANDYEDVYKIFYKTSILAEDEKERVNSAGWRSYDICDIYPLFCKYKDAENIILKQYFEYICNIFTACTNTSKPKSSSNKVECLAWQSYFSKVVVPELKDNNRLYTCDVWKNGRYPFACFSITKYGYKKNIPYLEIRSSDCSNDSFVARIMCYGVKNEDLETQQPKLISNIKAMPDIFKCKSHKDNKKHPKQVGKSFKEQASNDHEFIALVKKYAEYYLQVMKDWE